jgi:hypothetical protein
MVRVDIVELERSRQLVRNGPNAALQLADLLEGVKQFLGIFRRVAADVSLVDQYISQDAAYQ